MEILSPIVLGTVAAGQTITKNTSVSIVLVIMLVAATITMTNLFNTVSNDINNLKADVGDIKLQQATIIEALTE